MVMARIDKVLLLVGRLNYTWTNTESLLIYLIAHLMGSSKEAAIVVFLTLNTTRARLELIERLSKMKSVPDQTRETVLDIVAHMKQEAKLRNKYNHCIYAFDTNGELESTQLMRIAEFGDDLKYGKVESLDDEEIERIATSINQISRVNKSIWSFLNAHGIDP
jgi:hypothetical protein